MVCCSFMRSPADGSRGQLVFPSTRQNKHVIDTCWTTDSFKYNAKLIKQYLLGFCHLMLSNENGCFTSGLHMSIKHFKVTWRQTGKERGKNNFPGRQKEAEDDECAGIPFIRKLDFSLFCFTCKNGQLNAPIT